jgi:UDP-glucose 4-epimerase
MNVVVTGAAGYIGGQIALQLADAGHSVTGIDRRPLPRHLEGVMQFLQADFDSDESYRKLVELRPDAVVHCAGTSLVAPSIKQPSDYYHNNVVKTMNLLNIMMNAVPRTRFIFSSSAAVYGEPVMTPCQEVDTREPVSPYGESKLMVEQILASYHHAYGLDYVAFRYFNACGADSQGRHGQESGATHIIARALESVRDNTEFVLNGVEYPTPDGTCVRDYVHVQDIARAHMAALNPATIPSGVYNLGSAAGHSNRQIIAAITEITGKPVNVQLGNSRTGDPAVLTADSTQFDQLVVDWRQYNLRDMITHAWAWYV